MKQSSMDMLACMLQMKQLEIATLKVANETLRERIQWLEHLAGEFQDKLYQKDEEPVKTGKRETMGFHEPTEC